MECPDPRAGDVAAYDRWCEAGETPPWEEPEPEDPRPMALEACDLLMIALRELRLHTGRTDLDPAFAAVREIRRMI